MTNVALLLVLQARAEARAILFAAGKLTLQDAVDGCQQYAEACGLVAEIGQDKVQEILAAAFAPHRHDLDKVPDPLVLQTERNKVAESTIQAAEYLIQQNDACRFENWLAKHNEQERLAILGRIIKRRRRA